MVRKLDLAMMNKSDDEMNAKEMNAVKGGMPKCECGLVCSEKNEFNAYYAQFDSIYDAGWFTICSCGSIWNYYGLSDSYT